MSLAPDVLEALITTPPDMRMKAQAVQVRAQKVAGILACPATTAAARRRAKDELRALWREAQELWRLV